MPQKMSNKITRSTQDKKRDFIELYRETRGFITDICRSIGIARKTYYNWLDADEEFAMAVAEAEAEINDEMKQLLIHQAQADNNTTALIFWLKNKHPEFNSRNKEGTTNIQNNYFNMTNTDKDKYDI